MLAAEHSWRDSQANILFLKGPRKMAGCNPGVRESKSKQRDLQRWTWVGGGEATFFGGEMWPISR